MSKILLVAQSGVEANRLVAELDRDNYTCSLASSVNGALEQLGKHLPDLCLINLTDIPESDRLCKRISQDTTIPILAIVTIDAVLSLDGTVADFVLSPVNPQEVIARVKRLLHQKAKQIESTRITFGSLTIDIEKYKVYMSGKPVSLTYREYELLKFLATNPGRVFTRDTLLNRVWGDDFFGGDRTVDVHIRRLRAKIEDDFHTYIETVRNIGYRFVNQS